MVVVVAVVAAVFVSLVSFISVVIVFALLVIVFVAGVVVLMLFCSTGLPCGNQVDDLPHALNIQAASQEIISIFKPISIFFYSLKIFFGSLLYAVTKNVN